MDEPTDPTTIVRHGYDLVSHAYRADTFDYAGSDYERLLTRALANAPGGLDILDLGCGNGVPVSQVLAQSHRVTGADVSKVQLQRATTLVRAGRFILADLAHLAFRPGSFDGIMAFYSIIHVPVEEHPRLFRTVAEWLRPGGFLLAIVGHTAWTGIEDNWHEVLGGTMYWSHAGRESYLQWIADAGLTLEWEDFIPEGNGGHTAIFARCRR